MIDKMQSVVHRRLSQLREVWLGQLEFTCCKAILADILNFGLRQSIFYYLDEGYLHKIITL